MSSAIRESDWKLFRELHPLLLNRFCERVLTRVAELAGDDTRTPHQRYLELYELMRKSDRALAGAFDDQRRSTALLQLRIMHAHDLLTEAELARFSSEAKDTITWRPDI